MFRQRLRHTYNTIETKIFSKKSIKEVLQTSLIKLSMFNYHSKKEDNPSEFFFDGGIDLEYLIGSFEDIPSNINAHGSCVSQRQPFANGNKADDQYPLNQQHLTLGDLDQVQLGRDKEAEKLARRKLTFGKRDTRQPTDKQNTFFNPEFQAHEREKHVPEDRIILGKISGKGSGDENEKTFDVSNIPLIASISENSLMAKPKPSQVKETKKEKTDFFLERFETLKHRQMVEKKIKSSKKNIQKNSKKQIKPQRDKAKRADKPVEKKLKEEFQKRMVIQDMIFTRHSSEKNIYSAKKRARNMASKECQAEKSGASSPKMNMFLLNDFNEQDLGDSVCDNAIFVSNKFDFMAIGGRSSRKLKLFSFEKKNFNLDCELTIFKSEPTDILFYGRNRVTPEKRLSLVCGDDHNVYVVNVEDYLAGKGPPKLTHKFKDVHINKCMALTQFQDQDLLITQKQGILNYISLTKFKIIGSRRRAGRNPRQIQNPQGEHGLPDAQREPNDHWQSQKALLLGCQGEEALEATRVVGRAA